MIEVAKYAGFCFGVSRAVSAVGKLIEKGGTGKIFTLGNIIHNPTVIAQLENAGVITVSPDMLSEIFEKTSEKSPSTVVIRTHGIEKNISDELHSYEEKNRGFHVLDCTCPFVKKIQDIVRVNSDENSVTLIFGDESHPEVQSIKSYVEGTAYVFSSEEELIENILPHLSPDCNIIMVSQTTQKLSEWKNCQKNIGKLYTNAKIFDTICSVTENRQTETTELSGRVDVMIVIGGKNSSNTNKLYSIAGRICPRTYLIETADEARKIKSVKNLRVGITAGASTPDSIIQEVQTIMSEEIKDSEELTMNAEATDETMSAEDSFEKMLDETFKTLNTGDVVTGVITSISPAEIHVDLGAKVTGILSCDDVTDDPGVKLDEMFKVGDEVTAYAVRVSDVDGVATLSKKRYDAKSNWLKVVESEKSGEYLEGKFIEIVHGGAIALIKGTKAFVPASHTTVEDGGDMNALIGQKMLFKIIEVDTDRKRVKASARIPAREAARTARREAMSTFWDEIEVGKVYEGTVKSLQSYGAFVDLGAGIDGLVHTTELSWNHIASPESVVSVGDKITVFVKSFDREKKRISLGYKTEETNPWHIFTSQYQVGDIVKVKIVNIMPFGAFGEVVPGADGLIHISELSDRRVAKPEDIVSVGDEVDVKIISIDDEKRKIGLSMRALLETNDEEYEDNEETEDTEN